MLGASAARSAATSWSGRARRCSTCCVRGLAPASSTWAAATGRSRDRWWRRATPSRFSAATRPARRAFGHGPAAAGRASWRPTCWHPDWPTAPTTSCSRCDCCRTSTACTSWWRRSAASPERPWSSTTPLAAASMPCRACSSGSSGASKATRGRSGCSATARSRPPSRRTATPPRVAVPSSSRRWRSTARWVRPHSPGPSRARRRRSASRAALGSPVVLRLERRG